MSLHKYSLAMGKIITPVVNLLSILPPPVSDNYLYYYSYTEEY